MPAGTSGAVAYAPRLPTDLLYREALVTWLERHADRSLIVVRSPAGGGKTTLIADWVDRHRRPGVWVSLDRSARGRLAFWRRVVGAVLDAGLAPPNSVLHDIVVSSEIADELPALLARGFSTLAPLRLVLDDFHEVTDPSVHDDLHTVLASASPLHVVIGTRALTQLELPERIARVDTAVLPIELLPFSTDEVRDAAALIGSPESADDVSVAFAGWPLPTRAALVVLRAHPELAPAQAIERVRRTVTGIDVEALGESDYGRFMLRTSIAKGLTRALAVELGGPSADEHLARAEREGVGTWTFGPVDEVFAVHPYLREQLETQFVARLPHEVAEARSAYARDRVRSGDISEAARQFAEIGDAAGLTDLVRRHYPDVALAGEAFGEALDTLGEAQLRKHPELLTFRMLLSSREGRTRHANLAQLGSLISALIYARLGGGEPVERAGLLIALLAAQRASGHYEQAAKTAERLASALAFLDDERKAALRGLIPTALVHIGTSFLYQGEAERANEFLRTAEIAATDSGRPWVQLHALSMQQLVMALRGDHRRLEAELQTARRRTSPSGWRGTYIAAGFHLAEAFDALEHFDTATARDQLAALAAHEHTIEHWAFIAEARAIASLIDGKPYVGLQTLSADIAAHADRPPTSQPMSARLLATRADLFLADRHALRAERELRPIRRERAAQLVLARIHLVRGDFDAVLGIVTPLAWEDRDRPRTKAEALLLASLASHRLDRAADARSALDRALTLLDRFGLRRPLMTVPRDDLVAVLQTASVDSLRLLDGVPDVSPPIARSWRLTTAEARVLALLDETGRTDELAARLHVSANTVKSHLRQIYRKLEVRSRDQALAVIKAHGLHLDRED